MGRRRRKGLGLTLNKYRIGLPFVVLGALYFFVLSLADGSPVLKVLSENAAVIFGQQGTDAFFAVCIMVGLYVLIKPHLIKLILKQFLLLFLIISAILNFPIVDGMSKNYMQFGGYLSRPLLWSLDYLFGGKDIATKVFVIILFLLVIVWIIVSFNIKLPAIKLEIPQSSKKSTKQSDRDLKKKLRDAQQEDEEDYDTDDEPEEEDYEEQETAVKSGSILKDLLKQKITGKLNQKTAEKKIEHRITFASDKPTFDADNLEAPSGQVQQVDEAYMVEKAKGLQSKLSEFSIPIEIKGFDIGPSVVQMKFKPEAGIKLSSIESLKNDITLGVRSKSLRIIAPIPGTDLVGIEIPNPKPEMVRLREVLCGNDFHSLMEKSMTNLALGKGIDGKSVIKPLEDMPHLLVAGSTGSGKSVGINDFILSLIYQNSPSELKFLMVDPKQVELGLYDGIPYLLAPIITKPDVALRGLKWAVNEMERRYELLKNSRVRNLKEYNKKFPDEQLYRVVIVIDELADLMMSGNKKDTETCITRIAQKARAVGMHLIVATQRPSVNVITGLIKANIPTRIAFGVVSQIDSRTILDMKGAEDLVGKGDMLYMDPNTKYPLRIQAPFVSTEESEKVVEEIKEKYMKGINESDIYNADLVAILEGKNESISFSGLGDTSDDDELVNQAIEIIMETKKASATMLQRKLGVGFARAARIMDILEAKGVVGPQEGAKPREVLV
ncbi:MAG TPA: DNA translocase FtsK [Candidatus Absconditabacterales bacterium]|nr:DNA translocase FtsK [Candidatus Absconditabacterales bacterium]